MEEGDEQKKMLESVRRMVEQEMPMEVKRDYGEGEEEEEERDSNVLADPTESITIPIHQQQEQYQPQYLPRYLQQ